MRACNLQIKIIFIFGTSVAGSIETLDLTNFIHYALVICNHGPPGPGEGGDSRGNELCFDESFAMVVQGEIPEVGFI